jgi:hypothetical protein
MMPMDKPTAEEIAHRAQEFKVIALAQQLSVLAIIHPELPLLRFHQQLVQVGPDIDIPLDLHGGVGHDILRLSVREILTAAAKLRGPALSNDLMAMAMLTAATQLGDMITNGGHTRREVPLLQFARHFRNAAAHGNRWHFGPGEPKSPASCRHLTLTPDLHGQRAAWGGGGVTPLLFVYFLDDLSNHFASGLVPPPQTVPTAS